MLKTGFNPGVELDLRADTEVGHLRGLDEVTGYDFAGLSALTGFEGASLGALGTIPEFIDFAVTDAGGERGPVLSMQCFKTKPGGAHNTRACYTLDFKQSPRFTQAYVKYRMKLHPAFAEAVRTTGGWLQIFEFKDYRVGSRGKASESAEQIHTLRVNVERGADGFHFSSGWRVIGPPKQLWHAENKNIPVKFGEWFTVELFLKPGPAGTGRFLYRIDGQTVFAIADQDIQYKDAPLHTLQIFKIYMAASIIDWMLNNGTPCQAWYDDLEIWDDLPAEVPFQ